jgi:peptide/nickel transport system substrate-binding protein
MIYDPLITGDIEATEEDWTFYGIYIPKDVLVGCLMESWEEVDSETVIFNLRHGVHFQNLKPVNGREMVADDVIYSFMRAIDPKSQVASAHNLNLYYKSIKKIDDYTIEYKYNPTQVAENGWWGSWYKSNTWVIPHEVVEANGGSLANPLGQVGTGPYMIKTWVPGSSTAYVKNPDYWGTDPRYPGNKIPYTDKVTFTVIADLSTRISALRTGKIDQLSSIPVNQFNSLAGAKASNGKPLNYRQMQSESSNQIAWRSDLPPFSNNLKFRQALSMAIDRQAIVDSLFNGNASYSCVRVPPSWPEFIPLSEYPADIQELFQYSPEKAKARMVEAGFPDGYTLEVIIQNTANDGLNILQMVAADWKDALNVTLNIKAMDSSQATSLQLKHQFPQGYYSPSGLSYPSYGFSFLYQPDNTFRTYNVGNYKDPTYNALYEAYTATYALPWSERYESWYNLCKYARQQCVSTDLPVPNSFKFWQPWLKGTWGQSGLNYGSSGDFYKYMWIDKS